MSQGAQAFPNLSLKDVDKIRSESQYVSAVSPVIMSRSVVIGPAGNWRTMINGVDTDYQIIRDWQTASGDFFSPDDVRANRTVAVLGNTVAQRLFAGTPTPLEPTSRSRNSLFKVTGVLAPKGQTASGSDSDDVVLIPYTTAATTPPAGRSFRRSSRARRSQRHPRRAGGDSRAAARVAPRQRDDNDDFTVTNQADLATAAESSTR